MIQNLRQLAAELTANHIPFLQNEPMSRHTTFVVGGAAALFIEPVTTGQILLNRRLCHDFSVKLMPVGRGSNLLIADSGFDFAVLHLGDNYSGIESVDENMLEVKSGTKLSTVCRYTADAGLSGLEFGYGIPGNMGGVIYMNAGAYGGEMKEIVRSVTFVDDDGEIRTMSGEPLRFGYRHSRFTGSNCIILSAIVEFTNDDPEAIRANMDEFMARRREKQPLEYGSAGSTFKRPEGAFASALIDQCGLKGYRIGGAEVSQKHAGFVVNTGSATCNDVLAVMSHVVDTVNKKTGYLLEPEIMILP